MCRVISIVHPSSSNMNRVLEPAASVWKCYMRVLAVGDKVHVATSNAHRSTALLITVHAILTFIINRVTLDNVQCSGSLLTNNERKTIPLDPAIRSWNQPYSCHYSLYIHGKYPFSTFSLLLIKKST